MKLIEFWLIEKFKLKRNEQGLIYFLFPTLREIQSFTVLKIFSNNVITMNSLLLPNRIKFIVRQIHRKKEKTQTQPSIKKVSPYTEYRLGNTKKLEVYESRCFLHCSHLENTMKWPQ